MLEVIHIVHRFIHRKNGKSPAAARQTRDFEGFPQVSTKFGKIRFGLQNTGLSFGESNPDRFSHPAFRQCCTKPLDNTNGYCLQCFVCLAKRKAEGLSVFDSPKLKNAKVRRKRVLVFQVHLSVGEGRLPAYKGRL